MVTSGVQHGLTILVMVFMVFLLLWVVILVDWSVGLMIPLSRRTRTSGCGKPSVSMTGAGRVGWGRASCAVACEVWAGTELWWSGSLMV